MAHKQEKFASVMRRELGRLLHREMEFDALVTIVNVDVSEKVGRVAVEITVFPTEQEEAVLRALQKAGGYLKYKLNKRLDFGRVPELRFRLSKGADNIERVEEILEEERPEAEEES